MTQRMILMFQAMKKVTQNDVEESETDVIILSDEDGHTRRHTLQTPSTLL